MNVVVFVFHWLWDFQKNRVFAGFFEIKIVVFFLCSTSFTTHSLTWYEPYAQVLLSSTLWKSLWKNGTREYMIAAVILAAAAA